MTKIKQRVVCAAGVGLMLLGALPTWAGVAILGMSKVGWFLPPASDRYSDDAEDEFLIVTQMSFVETTFGPFTFTGEWAWLAPMLVGSGGLLGGLALLIWAWRAKRG